MSFDLTGLPPSPDEITTFQNDTSSGGHEQVVDRLLASRALGEKWARHWLDLVGNADKSGARNVALAEHAWKDKTILRGTLTFSLFVFLVLAYGSRLTAKFDIAAYSLIYFLAALLCLAEIARDETGAS